MRHRGDLVVFGSEGRHKRGGVVFIKGGEVRGNTPTEPKGRLLVILGGVTVTTQGRPKGGCIKFPQKRGTKGVFLGILLRCT